MVRLVFIRLGMGCGQDGVAACYRKVGRELFCVLVVTTAFSFEVACGGVKGCRGCVKCDLI